jgi:cysteine synthase A
MNRASARRRSIGPARALEPYRPALRVVGVEPAESAVLAGDEPGP